MTQVAVVMVVVTVVEAIEGSVIGIIANGNCACYSGDKISSMKHVDTHIHCFSSWKVNDKYDNCQYKMQM